MGEFTETEIEYDVYGGEIYVNMSYFDFATDGEETLNLYYEDLRRENILSVFEVLERRERGQFGGIRTSILVRAQLSEEYCLERIFDVIWVIGEETYWLTVSACEFNLDKHRQDMETIIASFAPQRQLRL